VLPFRAAAMNLLEEEGELEWWGTCRSAGRGEGVP